MTGTTTADRSLHSQIEGSAPAGSTLKISKTFQTATSPVWQNTGMAMQRMPSICSSSSIA